MATHVASRFARHPGVIGFELFNEPVASAERLRAFHTELLAALRAAAPDKLMVFEPPAIRNLLDSADSPESGLGPGTAYAPHIYTAAFAGDDARASDLDANGTGKEREAVVAALSRVRLEACAGHIEAIDHRPTEGVLEVRFFGNETTHEHLVSFGTRSAARRIRCDGEDTPFAEGEPTRVTCGGAGLHVLAIDYAPRTP